MSVTDRDVIIGNLCASIYVVTNCLDMEMSSAIMKDTTRQYGEKECGDIMNEILDVMGGLETKDNNLARWVNAVNFAAFQLKKSKEDAYKIIH